MENNQKIKKRILSIGLLLTTLVIGITAGIFQVKPPKVDESSPIFGSMMSNLQSMAAEPHPSDSKEIETVRSQILAEIEDMGLSASVEDVDYTLSELVDRNLRADEMTRAEFWEQNKDMLTEAYGITNQEELVTFVESNLIGITGDDGVLKIKNILVKLDAPESDRGVLFVTHYDSAPGGGPGAADDMVAVCAMLEAMRAHTDQEALKNDLYFLFSDGEEIDLLGAYGFVEGHPELLDKMNMVINMEARGNRGGLLLFETSPDAYSLLDAARQSGARPKGFSWLAAVYSMMPNDTDLSVFLDNGYPGLNFAIGEGVETYHQPTDNYENINRSSAWDYLQTTLSLADYAADTSWDDLREITKEAVYFPVLLRSMVLLTDFQSRAICILAGILAIVWMIVQWKEKRLKRSVSVLLTGLLFLLSAVSEILFAPGSYLFYLPLLLMMITLFIKKWSTAYIAGKMITGAVTLMLWVPTIYLLWVMLVQPMML